MALDWNEKHRPQRLDDVVGNKKAAEELRAFAQAWASGKPKKKALILSGPPGTGKTTSALALARELGWGVIEMNASDQRNAEAVGRVAGAGALNETFTAAGDFVSSTAGGRKLIILDEADNLFGVEDRGGVQAIVKTIREAGQPIILIVNDYYELTRRSPALRTLTQQVKFTRVNRRTIPAALRRIAEAEGVAVDKEVLEAIAERSGGDLRAAVNDLQSLALGTEHVAMDHVKALGDRDARTTMFDAVGRILKTRDYKAAREAVYDVDETPDMVMLWIEENVAREYQDPADLARAFDALAKADVYLGRVRRRQYYGLWSYATDMMTAGVSLAKDRPYSGFSPWQFPSWLRKMSASRAVRSTRDGLADKLGALTHTSRADARRDVLPALRAIAQNDEAFARFIVREAALTPGEAGFLMDAKADDAIVEALFEEGTTERRDYGDDDASQAKSPEDEGAGEGDAPSGGKRARKEPEETADEDPKKKQKSLFEF